VSRDDESLRRPILDAARELNAGRFFEAHEALEEALDDLPDAYWELYLGLIQVAVGYHKLASGNDGAAHMLAIGLEKLAPFADDVLAIDVGLLRARAQRDLEHLEGGRRAVALDDLRQDPPRLLPAREPRSR
jgi:hypothetical protein